MKVTNDLNMHPVAWTGEILFDLVKTWSMVCAWVCVLKFPSWNKLKDSFRT